MSPEQFAALTTAERAVLRAALGRTNDQIAALLGISPNTVATHLLSARRKLGSVSKGDAARGFQAWELSHQKTTSPESVIADRSWPTDAAPVGDGRAEEERTPFTFPDPPPASPSENRHDRYRPFERTVLILLAAALLLACIKYLPDLVATALATGKLINPPHH